MKAEARKPGACLNQILGEASLEKWLSREALEMRKR